jgi:SAM-dependent methyltransferase
MEQKFSLFHSVDTASLREWHVPYANLFKDCSHVLDFGCGTGVFLVLLRERGVKCIGLEMDLQLVEQLTASGHTVYQATHEDLRTYGRSCDGIHISHVIEHLWGDDMRSLLEDCVECLAPNGLLVIRTPNWANKNVSGGGFWDDYTHKRPYSRRQLDRMLADLGMEIRSSGYEPFGWEDTYIVARKKPVAPGGGVSDQPVWSSSRIEKKDHSLKARIRRRLRLWLASDQ